MKYTLFFPGAIPSPANRVCSEGYEDTRGVAPIGLWCNHGASPFAVLHSTDLEERDVPVYFCCVKWTDLSAVLFLLPWCLTKLLGDRTPPCGSISIVVSITYEVSVNTEGVLVTPRRRSQINGNNGSFTNTDDVSTCPLSIYQKKWIMSIFNYQVQPVDLRWSLTVGTSKYTWSFARTFKYISSLSGSHGEWTGEDDLASGSHFNMKDVGEARDRQMQRKAASRRVSQKKKTNSKVKGPPEASSDQGDGGAIEEPAAAMAEPEVERIILVYNIDGWYFYQSKFFHVTGNRPLAEGKEFVLLVEGTRAVCSRHEPGIAWEGGNTEIVLSSVFYTEVLDEIGDCRMRLHKVCRPVYSVLKGKCPINTNGSGMQTIAAALCSRSLEDMPPVVFLATWEYHVHRSMLLSNGSSKRAPRLQLTEGELCNGLTYNYGGPTVIPSGECTLARDWAIKRVVQVKRNNVVMTPAQLEQFLTTQPEVAPYRYHRTQGIRFRGERDFVLYEVSKNNAIKALKRILGARVNEETYYQNQYQLFNNIGKLTCPGTLAGAIESVMSKIIASCDDLVVRVGVDEMDPDRFGWGRFNPIHIGGNVLLQKMKDVTDYVNVYIDGDFHIDSHVTRQKVAALPHVKKALREAIAKRNWASTKPEHFARSSQLTVKKEWAKPGKVPRLFCSYGDGSMLAPELPEILKLAMHGRHDIENPWGIKVELFILAKPDFACLEYIFRRCREVVDELNTMFVACFSDDSVYCGNINGEPFMFNVDISSCDSSNNQLVFGWTEKLLSRFHSGKAKALVEQCRQPLSLKFPDEDDMYTFTFHHPFEGSGTVLTTCLNNVASTLIAIGVVDTWGNGRRGLSITDRIVQGAANVGHLVTVESCMDGKVCVAEKLQFLKHSCFRSVDDQWVVALNYGPMLRSLGTLEGDISHTQLGMSYHDFTSMSVCDRYEKFVSGVVKGYANEPSSSVTNSLRIRFNRDCKVVTDYNCIVDPFNRSGVEISPESLSRRYPDYDIWHSQLHNIIAGSQMFCEYRHQLVDCIMRVDYGL